ncbi:hypothetical protein PO909_028082 [Leuciscus waleckii]
MENSLLMTLAALLLLGVRKGTSQFETPHVSNPDTTIPTAAPCPKPIHITHVLARLKVTWKKSPCEGRLYLYFPNQSPAPLCFGSQISESWSSELCKDMRCGDFKGFKPTKKANGHMLTSNITLINEDCTGLQITCEDTLGSELAAYKAVTGISLFLMLGVILFQLTYKAIRKRFQICEEEKTSVVMSLHPSFYKRNAQTSNAEEESHVEYVSVSMRR